MKKESEVYRTLEYFGIKTPTNISVGGGTASPKYLFTYSGKRYLLKKRRKEFTPVQVLIFDLSVIRYLSKNGLPVVVPSYSMEAEYELSEYIENLNTFSQGNREQMEQAAETLGKMHRILKDFVPEGKKDWKREFMSSEIKTELLKTINKQPEIFYEQETVIKCIELLDTLIESFSVKNLTHSITHGDYTSANVKFKNNIVGGIFDFDWASYQNTLYDISRGLVYFCFERRQELDGNNIWSLVQPCKIDIKKIKQFISSYKKEFVFTQADAEALPFAIKEFFIGSRVRAMRKVEGTDKIRMLDKKLLDMVETVEQEKVAIIEACK
jgi:Ser/Thr protein kinase RdoA (MazF antagonist)